MAIAKAEPQQRPVPASLPGDRSGLEALALKPEPLELQDEVVLRRQMGHRPRLALGVLRRCRYGYPQVLLFAPLLVAGDRVSPNSTLCWLSCPLLVRHVDRLEKEGEIDRFEHLAAVDAGLREAMHQAHQAAARARSLLLPPEWAERLRAERPREYWVVTQTGIAGITRPDHVKCLHAHLAHYMARQPNPVGEETARRLESEGVPLDGSPDCWRWCSPEGAWEHVDLRGPGAPGERGGDAGGD